MIYRKVRTARKNKRLRKSPKCPISLKLKSHKGRKIHNGDCECSFCNLINRAFNRVGIKLAN